MSLLSGNLLARAQRLIPPETVSWLSWASSTENAVGKVVPVYATAADILANVQAVPQSQYVYFQLDFQKEYLMLYTSVDLKDLRRDAQPDAIDWNGSRYTVESNTDWKAMNGWKGSLIVKQGPTP